MISTQRLVRVVPAVIRAGDPFGKYKTEESHEVRKADVTGQSYAEQVKRTRQMLRSMRPEAVSQIIEFHRGLNLFEALALAKREGKLIVPNDIHDRILMETKDEEYLRQNYPVWTGTLIIFEKSDTPLGDAVVFIWEHNKVTYSISFTIPEQFRGLLNCALVVEYPDFELVNLGNNRYELKLVEECNIKPINNFPKRDGWYLTDHWIPNGAEVSPSANDARRLWRVSDRNNISLIRRSCGLVDIDNKKGVVLTASPLNKYNVALL